MSGETPLSLKVIHVVPHIDKEAAGPSYSVPRLCGAQAQCGAHVTLSCLAARGSIEGVHIVQHPQWPVLPRFAISPGHAHDLWQRAGQVDIVHNHSLWSMVNVAAGWVVPSRGAKLVTSPRGTLSTWALGRNQGLKKLLWPLQRRALELANLLHATSETEYREIRAMGLRAPVAVIPNGIDLPDEVDPLPKQEQMTLLFLGRIHPVKGLERLLAAWVQLQNQQHQWRLVIAGPGEEAHIRAVKAQVAQLQLQRVEFSGPVYGQVKSQAYWNADLFVLPTHSENFGMVVAEALAHGLPAVVSRGAPWPGLQTHDCGWWVSNDVSELTHTLAQAMNCSTAQRRAMGQRGREWMAQEFGWPSIAQRMMQSYRWLLAGGTPPPWIRLD